MAKQIIPARVCVVGATGRIGSLLVRKLLERGHVVHATLRHLCDPEKTGLLKSFPGADERLVLFEADLLEAHRFEQAVRGCEFVFLVAFPMKPIAPQDSKAGGDPGEALVAALQAVLSACERSGTVRRLVYTGSVTTASPLAEDGLLRFRDFMDESCWTRPDVAAACGDDFFKFYVLTKTELEKQLVSYGDHKEGDNPLEVVILTCGLIGGEALVDNRTGVELLLSPLTGDTACFGSLKSLQDLLCSVPLVHLEDVCEAHLFCMDVPLTGGRRFLCASGYPTLSEIISYYRLHYSDLLVAKEPEEALTRRVTGGSTRLRDMGFEYKYGVEQILDDTVPLAKKLGLLRGTVAH